MSFAEQRIAEQRVAEQRIAEQRVAEQRVAEQRIAEQRVAEQRVAEQRDAGGFVTVAEIAGGDPFSPPPEDPYFYSSCIQKNIRKITEILKSSQENLSQEKGKKNLFCAGSLRSKMLYKLGNVLLIPRVRSHK